MTPITHPMTSPMTSSEIPITQPPTLRGTRVGARVTRQLAQTQCVSVRGPSVPWRMLTSPLNKLCVIVYASRSLHYISMLTSPLTKLRVIFYFYHTYSPSAESAHVIPIFTRLRRHLKQYKKATQDSFHPFISRTAATTLLLNGKQQHRRTSKFGKDRTALS